MASFRLKAIVCSANSENIQLTPKDSKEIGNSDFLYISKKFWNTHEQI